MLNFGGVFIFIHFQSYYFWRIIPLHPSPKESSQMHRRISNLSSRLHVACSWVKLSLAVHYLVRDTALSEHWTTVKCPIEHCGIQSFSKLKKYQCRNSGFTVGNLLHIPKPGQNTISGTFVPLNHRCFFIVGLLLPSTQRGFFGTIESATQIRSIFLATHQFGQKTTTKTTLTEKFPRLLHAPFRFILGSLQINHPESCCFFSLALFWPLRHCRDFKGNVKSSVRG